MAGGQGQRPRSGARRGPHRGVNPLQPPSVLSSLQVRGEPSGRRRLSLAALGGLAAPDAYPIPFPQSFLLHTAPTLPIYSDPDSPSSSSTSFTLADLWWVPARGAAHCQLRAQPRGRPASDIAAAATPAALRSS